MRSGVSGHFHFLHPLSLSYSTLNGASVAGPYFHFLNHFHFLIHFHFLSQFHFLNHFHNHFHFFNPLLMGQLAAPMQDFLIPPFLSLPTFNGAFSLSGAELHCHFVTLLSLSSSTFTFSLHFQLGHFPTETNGDFNFHFFTQLSKILLFGIYIGIF